MIEAYPITLTLNGKPTTNSINFNYEYIDGYNGTLEDDLEPIPTADWVDKIKTYSTYTYQGLSLNLSVNGVQTEILENNQISDLESGSSYYLIIYLTPEYTETIHTVKCIDDGEWEDVYSWQLDSSGPYSNQEDADRVKKRLEQLPEKYQNVTIAGNIDNGWFVNYEVWTVTGQKWVPNYIIENISSENYNRTGTSSSSSVIAYTHPGDCIIWSSLSSGTRLKSELIKVLEVNDWLEHYKKFLSWKNQADHYSDNINSYIPEAGKPITADWYNSLANLVGISNVSVGNAISNIHFQNLSIAISWNET